MAVRREVVDYLSEQAELFRQTAVESDEMANEYEEALTEYLETGMVPDAFEYEVTEGGSLL